MFIKIKNLPQSGNGTLPFHRNHPDQIDSPKQKSTPEHRIEYGTKNRKHKLPTRQQIRPWKKSPVMERSQVCWHGHFKQSTPVENAMQKEGGAYFEESIIRCMHQSH